MTRAAISANELPTIGEVSSPKSSPSALFRFDDAIKTPRPLQNTTPFSSMMADYELKPELAAVLQEARKKLANKAYNDESHSLSALRLGAGLSQSSLANLSGTSQSHIARIEAGKTDPGTQLIVKIAAALGVEAETAFTAIRHQVETRVDLQ